MKIACVATTDALLASRTRRVRRAPRAGFSLLELTLVVAIIGVLLAVVAVNVIGQGEKANIKATQASLATLKNAIASYNLEYKAYPTALNDLVTTKLVEPGLKDAWKRDFFYSNQGRPGTEQEYLLSSLGKDGAAGTADDISVWDLKK